MESNVLKAVEEISGYTPDEMIAMYNDYGRMAKEWEAYASAGLSPEVCAEYRKFEDEVVASGMTFGEVVELMHAEKDGRLVTLPCKVGDMVYVVDTVNGITDVYQRNVTVIMCNGWDGEFFVKVGLFGSYRIADFGKTVFLTRTLAEEALTNVQKEL